MNTQKRLASQVMKASKKRIKFDNQRLADIKEAITKTDVRQLINEGAITRVQKRGVSNQEQGTYKAKKPKDKEKAQAQEKEKKPQDFQEKNPG